MNKIPEGTRLNLVSTIVAWCSDLAESLVSSLVLTSSVLLANSVSVLFVSSSSTAVWASASSLIFSSSSVASLFAESWLILEALFLNADKVRSSFNLFSSSNSCLISGIGSKLLFKIN